MLPHQGNMTKQMTHICKILLVKGDLTQIARFCHASACIEKIMQVDVRFAPQDGGVYGFGPAVLEASNALTCTCTMVLSLQKVYWQVMEVLPQELAERMELRPAVLQAGKATCVLAARARRCCINVQLMDVLDLQLSL